MRVTIGGHGKKKNLRGNNRCIFIHIPSLICFYIFFSLPSRAIAYVISSCYVHLCYTLGWGGMHPYKCFLWHFYQNISSPDLGGASLSHR